MKLLDLFNAGVAAAASKSATTAASAKTTMQVARDVIAGEWGSGQARVDALKKAGYNPDVIQAEVNRLLCCRELIIQNIRAFATKTAAENYVYIYFNEKYGKECAKCHPHGGANKGWQCIGFAMACWHHAGLPIPCNCGVIDNATWEKILKASTDAKALKLAQDHLKIKDIQVIRNKNGIPKSQVKPGDMAALFDGTTYHHTFIIMSSTKVADSTKCKNSKDDIRADRNLSGRYVSGMKVIIRYTGNGFTTPAKKSVDELAHEVINGMWGSGTSRKTALTECGYDYNAIQKRVDELLGNSNSTTPTKTIEELAQEVLNGVWGSGKTRKQKLEAAGYDYDAVQARVNELLSPPAEVVPDPVPIPEPEPTPAPTPTPVDDGAQPRTIAIVQQEIDAQRALAIKYQAEIEKYSIAIEAAQSGLETANEEIDKLEQERAELEEKARLAAEQLAAEEHERMVQNLAIEVLDGKWGSGDKRKANLEAAGYNYTEIQTRVNEILAQKEEAERMEAERLAREEAERKAQEEAERKAREEAELIDKLAHEVLDAKWGSGDKRKANLVAAGYDYDKVQARVNELLANKSATLKTAYPGVIPSYRLVKSNAEVIADTIAWAKIVAANNDFHYGHGQEAHHNGCYFCGTQPKSKKNAGIVNWEHTYCCNPFVGAAWAHGGCVPAALKLCQGGSSWDFHKGKGYDKSKLFDNLGHPAKSKLKAGDVLCKDTHVALYIGGGKIAEASGGDDNKKYSTKWNNSIHVTTLTDSKYKGFKRVHRFNSSVNADTVMRHGEFGTRVSQWQAFLDWYFDGQVGKPYEGFFGDNTLKWTKKFQEEVFGAGQGDGLVGPKTLEAARTIQK